MTVPKIPRNRTHTTEEVAGLYVRISDDREGQELGIDRQVEDGRKHAERLGVRIHRIYKDNDIGASTRSSKPRPEYKQLLADAQAGVITMVIAYTSGRLTRRPMEHEGQIQLAEQFGTQFRYVRSPDFDLNTSAGRRIARILAANDAGEAEDIGERVSRARRQQAEAGKFGGGTRPYGFGVQVGTVERKNRKTGQPEAVPVYDYTRTVPAEAAVIRNCAEQVLADPTVPMREITRDLNNRNVPTAKGGKWLPIVVRAMLLRPRNAGILVNTDDKGITSEVGRITDKDGNVVDPILSEEVWRTVVDKLSDPKRRTNVGGPAPKWLGSGIYLCWKCGRVLRVHGAAQHKDRPAYRCAGGVHVTRTARPLDDYVTALIIERMSRPDASDLVRKATPGIDVNALRKERDVLRKRLTGLAESFAEGDISKVQLNAGTARINDKLRDVEQQLAEQVNHSPLAPLIGVSDVRAAWEGLSLGQQRATIKTLMVVTVLPAPRGRGFDPSYVSVKPAE